MAKAHTLMKLGAALAAAVIGAGSAQAVSYTDTVQANTGFFVPSNAQRYDSPYYRGTDEDWGWTHGAIAVPFTSATLNISAFDVDAPAEVDNIYAYDDGVRTLIGTLTGFNDQYSFTTFTLGANFFNDIAAGLKVDVDIDAERTGWVLTLAKSSLSVDGGVLPPAPPGVPEPATWAMMLSGFGLVGAMARRRRTVLQTA